MLHNMLVQPALVNAITDIDDKCIKLAYKIGYNISETYENKINALAQLEADCIYQEK
jgi:cysteinyl-tRNA synthetase